MTDLREAWVNFTRPAVSTVVKKLLEQLSADFVVPDTALDLTALQDVIDKCTPRDDPAPSITSPNVTIKLVSKAKIGESRLDRIALSAKKLRLTLSKDMTPRKRDLAVAKAQALATFLLQHGIKDDAVQFVLGVHKLVPPDYPLNWKLWLRAPKVARRPPLWWRVLMMIVEADAMGGKRYKLQARACSLPSNTYSAGVRQMLPGAHPCGGECL